MSDRELLELAAKAIGMRLGGWEPCDGGYFTYAALHDDTKKTWLPLTDDGDALRLLVLLGMSLTMTDTWVGIETPRGLVTVGFESCSGDKSAATRRVIVMAAGDYYEG